MYMTIMKPRSILILKESQVKQLVDKLLTELNGKHGKFEKHNKKTNKQKDIVI